MSSITNFLANFNHGFRSNLFRVNVTNLPSKMEFVCKASQIPGKEIGAVEVNWMNKIVPLRGDATFPDWTTTILLDTDFSVKTEIEQWQERMQSNRDVRGATNTSDYFGLARVDALGGDGETVIASYELFNLWPLSSAQIDLNWENRDALTEFEVTWRYTHWERVV